jgi:hypothetical protein
MSKVFNPIETGSAGVRSAALAAFAAAVLLSGCDPYDEGLVVWSAPGDASGNAGAGGGAPQPGPGGGFDAAVGDAGVSDGEVNEGDSSTGKPPAPGCVPGEDEFCEWVCPEACDGVDNDCDGDIDEDPDEICDLPGAVAQCVKGDCVITECAGLLGNCDGDTATGCETPLDTLDDCGACGSVCDGDTCAGGICTVIGGCDAEELADCDGNLDNGCETALTTLIDCGACGAACLFDNAISDCSGMTCEFVECIPGFGDCDDDLDNGCETALTTLTDCGACGRPCDGASCAGGSCTPVNCGEGLADCDGDGTSCETSLRTLENCGFCSAACGPLDNATASCWTGSCQIDLCDANFGDCDSHYWNGCESSLLSNQNCAECGTPCGHANAVSSCSSGSCEMVNCRPGFESCDEKDGNGCEIDLTNDVENCGACSLVCEDLPHASEVCSESECGIGTCDADWADCTDDPGCETALGTVDHCAECGDSCLDIPRVDTVACESSACVIQSCMTGYEDCTNDPGCETALGTEENCSGCGDDCAALPNVDTAACESNVCVVSTCSDGWGDCDSGQPGCETPLGTVDDCAACGDDCNALANTDTVACNVDSCEVVTCDSGWGDCNDTDSDGCETTAPSFGYTPSNFSPAGLPVDPCPSAAVVLDCGTSTFDSQTFAYGNWCGQTQPAPVVRTQSGGPDVVVISLRGLTVASGSTLRLTGDRPVILAVFGDATVEGSMDVGSQGWTARGAGGNSSVCGSSNGGPGMDDDDGDDGASGGGGGGFGSAGAYGGQGFAGAVNTTGVGGIAGGNEEISPLRGGCRGGQGGKGWTSSSNGNARGGFGGGALQVSVTGTLSVAATAVISAAGGGGEDSAGNDEDGGAGGGSGGALLLEAWSVQMASNGWLTANGGGGSEGGDTWDGSYCTGADGSRNSSAQAPGGSGGCGRTDGAGGDGGFGASNSGAATGGGNGCCDNGDAGGGGGGGVGRIRIRGANACAVYANSSPAATIDCP